MKILVVDDDIILADVLGFTLRREGFDVLYAADGAAAIECWQTYQPEMIILDVNMPKLDGFEVCKRIRAESNVPILLLTVRSEEADIIHGLDIGADDYLIKPFSPRQLVARIKAILRRAGEQIPVSELHVGDMRLHSATRMVTIISQQKNIRLTSLEFNLLEYLMRNAGQVATIEALISQIWGPAAGDQDMLRQLVYRLRAKIEHNPSQPAIIETVPGLGYGIRK